MKRLKVFLPALMLTSSALAQQLNLFSNAKPYLELRPRYEFVEDKNNNLKNAHALTLKTAIGLKLLGIFKNENLNGYVEATNVTAVIDKFSPENNKYDLVPDPNNTRITQAYISYTLNKTNLSAGRKFVIIDDHRFIGNVIWRQMPQSFTVFTLSNTSLPKTHLLFAAIYERLGILDKLNTRWQIDKMPLIFDAKHSLTNWLSVKGFAYLITDIHNTYGIKLNGNKKHKEYAFSYLGEYAKQTDPYKTDNIAEKPDIDTDYWRAGLTVRRSAVSLGLEYTHFGDKNGKDKGFSTPLSTLHKFEGWSDVLLTGSANGYDYGLDEYKLSVGINNKKYGNFGLSYLLFNSYKSQPKGKKIGDEIDVIYTKNLYKNLQLLTKAAFYKADNGYYSQGKLLGTKDVNKLWIQLTYKY